MIRYGKTILSMNKMMELALIYVDRHLIHEVTSPQAFEGLRFKKEK